MSPTVIVPLLLLLQCLFCTTTRDTRNNYGAVNRTEEQTKSNLTTQNVFFPSSKETFEMRKYGDSSLRARLPLEKQDLRARLRKRHTPFMPEDHWTKANPPRFGATTTNVTAVVNGTARLVCPIGHLQDSAVRSDCFCLSYFMFSNR